jgi:GNAT superfamily N-acetyltransferase
MVGLELFTENLFSFVNMLGRRGDLLEMPSGSVAAFSGEPYAGENWALFTPRADTEELDTVMEFFSEYVEGGAPFIVPKIPGTTERFITALEKYNLTVRKRYTAMRLAKSKTAAADEAVVEVNDDFCAAWARAVWFGFGGSGNVTESYVDFARTMLADKTNKLYSLNIDSRPVCTALVHRSQRASGLYYFSTLPDYRRRGIARRLMNHIMREEVTGGRGLVLLSTEEGKVFYKVYGFEPVADIPVRSATDDI